MTLTNNMKPDNTVIAKYKSKKGDYYNYIILGDLRKSASSYDDYKRKHAVLTEHLLDVDHDEYMKIFNYYNTYYQIRLFDELAELAIPFIYGGGNDDGNVDKM